MSIYNAMYSGISGLTAEGDALGVIGNNLANSNTVGFKESRAVFENVLGAAVGVGAPIGAGVQMKEAQQIFGEGSLVQTGQPTDLALSGDGFFVVGGAVGGVSGDFYTRAGQTSLDSQGNLVNPGGLTFQGFAAKGDGTFSSTMGPIHVDTAALSPKETSSIDVTANLDATSTPPTAAWDPQNPSATSNFSTSMQVYDSTGTAHNLSVYFCNNGSGSWTYHVLGNGADMQGGTAGQNDEVATGSLAFDTKGALQSNTVTSGGTVAFNGSDPNQALTFNFGTPASTGGTGLDGITQFGSANNISAQSQNGYASGALSGVTVDSSGVVSGVYSNGQTVAVAQLAVAKFPSNGGLTQAGQSLWSASSAAGNPAVGTAGSGGRASIVTGALENSNVDIAAQFVDLIAHQRSFQADSKTVTTADQMLQDVVSMKQ